MSAYVKISYSSKVAGSYNSGLKQSIIYIGKRYGKYADVEGVNDKEYQKEGIAYIAKKFGKFRKSAIRYMIYPKNIKESSNKQWYYHKHVYSKAYALILRILLNAPPQDTHYIHKLLNDLYYENCNGDNNVARLCSNALIYWQKKMLSVNRNDVTTGEDSGILLREIQKYDRYIP